jgi:hypothetical protein
LPYLRAQHEERTTSRLLPVGLPSKATHPEAGPFAAAQAE